MIDVVGIGSPFVDYLYDGTPEFLAGYGLSPEEGRTYAEVGLTVEDLQEQLPLLGKSPGGMSGNTVAALAHLGHSTGFASIVGADRDGAYWTETLSRVDTS